MIQRPDSSPYRLDVLSGYALLEQMRALVLQGEGSPESHGGDRALLLQALQSIPRTAVVSLPGDNLDIGNVKGFRAAIQPIADEHDILVIDMTGLQFVDSSGVGALLSCLRTLGNKKGQLMLSNLTLPVRELFELIRIHRIFSICRSREDALRGIVGL